MTRIPPAEREEFIAEIALAIEPFNVAGLGNAQRRHWYPAEMRDLIDHADKLDSSKAEVSAMIEKVMQRRGCA